MNLFSVLAINFNGFSQRARLLKLLPTTLQSGSCYSDFSASGIVCQVRLLGVSVARHYLFFVILLTLFVEKNGGIVVEILRLQCYNQNMAYIRKFKTTSGATGVQVCYKQGNDIVKTVHVGSSSSDDGIKKLMREAQGIIDQGKKPLFNLDKFNK